jgi:hypothetical protein
MRRALLLLAALLVSCGGDDGGDPTSVPDTQPPDVVILEPLAEAGVSGSVEIRVAAVDNRGVLGVLTFIDGVQLGNEDTETPYTTNWNSTTATNGAHLITATARDAAGYVGTSPEIRVIVSGGI